MITITHMPSNNAKAQNYNEVGMKKGSAEFIEMQKAFEESGKVNTWVRLHDFSKPSWDANVPAGVFYNNGDTNTAFHHFMHGYGCGRLNYMHGAA